MKIQAILLACLAAAVSAADMPAAEATTNNNNNLRGDQQRELKKGGGRACGKQLMMGDCAAKFDDGCGWCEITEGRKGKKYGGKCITLEGDDADDTSECISVTPDDSRRELKKGGRGRACGRKLNEGDCGDGCEWCPLTEGFKGREYGGKCITVGEDC